MSAPGDFLTVAEVLRIVPLGKTTVYSLADSGQLPSYRVSAAGSRRGRVLIAKADLETFLARSRTGPPRAATRVADDLFERVRTRQERVAL